MESFKRLTVSPYTYIFLSGYYIVWLLWNAIKLPYGSTPAGIISYLPAIHYNPASNVLRLLMAIFLPPFFCLLFWIISNAKLPKRVSRHHYNIYGVTALVTLCIILSAMMGIVQGSTNPANNDPNAFGAPYKYAEFDTFHEGETVGPAISYQQKGLKPYRDFTIVHGVFQDPLRSVIAFKIFGQSIGATRAFAVILTMLCFLLYYVMLLVLFRGSAIKSALAFIVLAATLVTQQFIPFIGAQLVGINLPFRDISTILFLIAAVIGLRNVFVQNSRRLMLSIFAVGFITIVSFANSIDRAFYIAGLAGCWLVMLLIMQPVRSFVRTTIPPFIIGLLVGFPILGLAIKWAFKDFIGYMLLMSKYKEYLDGMIFQRPGLGVNLILVSVSLAVMVAGYSLNKLFTTQKFTGKSRSVQAQQLKRYLAVLLTRHSVTVLLVLTGFFFLRSAVGRADPSHFNYSVQWAYLAATFVFIEHFLWGQIKNVKALTFTTVILLLGFVASYSFSVKHIDIRHDTFPIHLKDSAITRSDFLQTADYLKANLHGQDRFVSLTSEGSWYYFVDSPSPIRYYVIWYAFTGSQRAEIAYDLHTNKHIKYIVTNNNWTSNFDYVANPARFPEVYKVLNRDFVPTTGFGQQTVWAHR